MNSKLHAVVDRHGLPIALTLTEGQRSDHIGVKLLYLFLPSPVDQETRVPHSMTLISDRGYDSDEFRAALVDEKIAVCQAFSPASILPAIWHHKPAKGPVRRRSSTLVSSPSGLRRKIETLRLLTGSIGLSFYRTV